MPAGTANLFASNLGIPKDLDEAVRVGLHGARRTIDLGKTNGEHFGVMSGAGLDAFMIRDAEEGGLKDRIGSLAYVFSGSKNLSRDPVRMKIEVDGATWFDDRAACVLVANVGDVIGGISAFPDARPDDGVLDIGVITAGSGLDWLRTLTRSVVSDPEKSPFVQTTTGTSFDIRMEEPLLYEMDGSERGMTRHLKTKVKPHAITVCVPETETA
jgi:diacylglycerol kinase family enzyme